MVTQYFVHNDVRGALNFGNYRVEYVFFFSITPKNQEEKNVNTLSELYLLYHVYL